MHAFAVLADPVRRCIVEQLVDQELSSGEIVDTVGKEFGISQSAISQQLKVLRENGFASVAIDGNRRLYSLDSTGFEQMEQWFEEILVVQWTYKSGTMFLNAHLVLFACE